MVNVVFVNLMLYKTKGIEEDGVKRFSMVAALCFTTPQLLSQT